MYALRSASFGSAVCCESESLTLARATRCNYRFTVRQNLHKQYYNCCTSTTKSTHNKYLTQILVTGVMYSGLTSLAPSNTNNNNNNKKQAKLKTTHLQLRLRLRRHRRRRRRRRPTKIDFETRQAHNFPEHHFYLNGFLVCIMHYTMSMVRCIHNYDSMAF